MSQSLRPPTPSLDDALTAALRERTRPRPGDDALRERVLDATATLRQVRSFGPFGPVDVRSRRPLVLVGLAAMLVVALLGVALAGGLLHRPAPRLPGNGMIIVLAKTQYGSLHTVDPVTAKSGSVLDVFGAMPVDAHDPAWSPDGRSVVGSSVDGVRIYTGAGRSPALGDCSPDPCELAWAPDGTWIAIASPHAVELVRPDGTARRPAIVPDHRLHYVGPAFSPDSRRLAIVESDGIAVERLVMVDLGSGRRTTLVEDATDAIGVIDPVWEPDGHSIDYLATVANAPAPSGSAGASPLTLEVRRISADGGARSLIAAVGRCFCLGFGPGMTRSPDGTTFAISTIFDQAAAGLYLMDASGANLRQLDDASMGTPAWQPIPASP